MTIPEQVPVTVTSYQPRQVTETITRQVPVTVPEQVPVTVMTYQNRQVTENITRQVPVTVPEQVPVTVYQTVPRQVTRTVPASQPEPPRRPRRRANASGYLSVPESDFATPYRVHERGRASSFPDLLTGRPGPGVQADDPPLGAGRDPGAPGRRSACRRTRGAPRCRPPPP